MGGLGSGAIGLVLLLGASGAGHGASVPIDVGVAPLFVEVTGAIDHRYTGDYRFFEGGGVAAFDCDGDGRSELYLAGGENPAALYHNDSEPGRLRFTPRSSPVTDMTAVTGAYPLDVDSDGRIDLAVLR